MLTLVAGSDMLVPMSIVADARIEIRIQIDKEVRKDDEYCHRKDG